MSTEALHADSKEGERRGRGYCLARWCLCLLGSILCLVLVALTFSTADSSSSSEEEDQLYRVPGSNWARPVCELNEQQVMKELEEMYMTNYTGYGSLQHMRHKLALVRRTQPITHGLAFGQPLLVGNTEKPTGLVVLLHGLGGSGKSWQASAKGLARRYPHLLFLLPTAPPRRVRAMNSKVVRAWFGQQAFGIALNDWSDQHLDSAMSSEYVASLTAVTCAAHGIPPSRVCVGGFSQGGAIALAVGLLAEHPQIAGVAVLSSFVKDRQFLMKRHRTLRSRSRAVAERFRNPDKATSFLVTHGKVDLVVPFRAGKKVQRFLEEDILADLPGEHGKVDFRVLNMQHRVVPACVKALGDFIGKVLP